MSAWGTGFWQNDAALDVKEDFRKYFKYGSTDKQGMEAIMSKSFETLNLKGMFCYGLKCIVKLIDYWI